jgi:RNA polymerase sigma factor (sigma-70 family)
MESLAAPEGFASIEYECSESMNLSIGGANAEEHEATLIRRIVAGEKDLFRSLVDAHKGMTFSLIMRQVNNRAIAEELTQEIFVKAYLNLSRFRGDSKFSTWLTRIALNHCNTYFSSKAYKESMRADIFEPEKHGGMTEGPGSETDESTMLARFRDGKSSCFARWRAKHTPKPQPFSKSRSERYAPG